MNKRGQVTIFVIVGIVIVVSIFLVFYFLGDKVERDTDVDVVFDESSLEPLKDYIENCIEKHGNEAIDLVLKQGGMVNPGLYYNYQDSKINYLCHTNGFSSCENKYPFVNELMEDEIKTYLLTNIPNCVDLSEMRNEGYTVTTGSFDLNLDVTEYNMIVDIYYPITISKGETQVTESKFVKSFEVPLGRFAEVAEDIVDDEILFGEFFYQMYEANNFGITIIPFSVGPTVIYKIKERNYDKEFVFAVRGWVA